MAAACSLHAGLDVSDHPRFRTRPSFGCARAAAAMSGLARELGYRAPVLLQDSAATAGAFVAAFRRLAASLEPGDLLLVSFAGHGRRLWGRGGAERPHALCFRDRELLDGELADLVDEIGVRARVVLVVDACGSGGLIRPRAHTGDEPESMSRAEVLLLASCPPAGLSRPAPEAGGLPPFTDALLRGWRACASYSDLRARIASIAGDGGASPVLVCTGAGGRNLMEQRPFVP